MSTPPEIIKEIRRWVEKAENDFRNAECVLALEKDCPCDTVCYHRQQCAEKYLQAFLIQQNVEFPKTHDLVVLFKLLPEKHSINLRVQDVQPLNRYSIEARYPGNWEQIDKTEARSALEMARLVRDAVLARLAHILLSKEDD